MIDSSYRNLIFLSEPDRYGRFGHQSFSLLTSWLFAHRFNCHFLPNQYSYFASKYNDYVDFSSSSRSTSIIPSNTRYLRLEGSLPDHVGNTKFNLEDSKSIQSFLLSLQSARRTSKEPICLQLPFDQTAGVFFTSINASMHSDLRQIFGKLICRRAHDYPISIAIHIRRGDVNEDSHPSWYIKDFYYLNLVYALFLFFKDGINVNIVTQGEILFHTHPELQSYVSSGQLRINCASQNFINDDEIEDFSNLLNADLLFSGQSSFSQLASLIRFGRIQVCVVKEQNSRLPHPIDVEVMAYALSDLSSIERAKTFVAKHLSHLLKKS